MSRKVIGSGSAIGIVRYPQPPEDYLALLTDEQIIPGEFRNSIDVGLALFEIRDRRPYRIDLPGPPDWLPRAMSFVKTGFSFPSRQCPFSSLAYFGGGFLASGELSSSQCLMPGAFL
jgi:hypothetical protein